MDHRPACHLSVLTALAFLALLPSSGSAQDYTQYEVQYMTVRPEATEDLNEALAEHNQEYHSGGAYHANVWYVANGPRTGQLVWVMGPLTFAQLDNRPAAGGHDDDWSGNVVRHLEPEADVSYWRRGDNLSYLPNTDLHPIIRVRFYEIADGQMFRWNAQMALVKEVHEAKSHPYAESVYRPRFRMEDGTDVATVVPFDSWADLDEGPPFRADFVDVHGLNAWQRFLNEMNDVVVRSWDEYRQLLPELSGSGS